MFSPRQVCWQSQSQSAGISNSNRTCFQTGTASIICTNTHDLNEVISSFFTVIFYHPGISLTDIYTLNLVFSCGDIRLRMIIMIHLMIKFVYWKTYFVYWVIICKVELWYVRRRVCCWEPGDGRWREAVSWQSSLNLRPGHSHLITKHWHQHQLNSVKLC